MAGLLKIGGLWKDNDKNGNEMLSGKVDVPVGVTITETTRVVILTNIHKDSNKHPDFNMFLTKEQPPEQQR